MVHGGVPGDRHASSSRDGRTAPDDEEKPTGHTQERRSRADGSRDPPPNTANRGGTSGKPGKSLPFIPSSVFIRGILAGVATSSTLDFVGQDATAAQNCRRR